VGDEDAVKALKAQTGLQDLALSTFTAVNQEAVFVMLDDLRRQTTLDRGR